MSFRDLTQAPETFAVHQVKEHLLAFRRQAMHFVKKQDAAMSLFDQPLAVTIRPGVGATHDTEEMRHQQLRVSRVVSAVKTDEGSTGG